MKTINSVCKKYPSFFSRKIANKYDRKCRYCFLLSSLAIISDKSHGKICYFYSLVKKNTETCIAAFDVLSTINEGISMKLVQNSHNVLLVIVVFLLLN